LYSISKYRGPAGKKQLEQGVKDFLPRVKKLSTPSIFLRATLILLKLSVLATTEFLDEINCHD
jgi:hypothetical protein